MDILGPLPETSSGNLYLLIICDLFTKFTRAIPLMNITAVDVTSALSEHWIAAYGPPDSVLTDNGPQFASLFFQGVCGLMGFKNLYTTIYHPQTNGQVERFNRTLVDMLRHYVEEHQDDWDELVAVLTLAYTSRPHRTTSIAPLDFLTPRRLTNFSLDRIPDKLLPNPGLDPRDAKDAFLELLKDLLPRVKESIAKTQARYKRDYDRRVRPKNKELKDGDWVFVDNHSQTRRKLDAKTDGPYEILDTDGWTFPLDMDGSPYRVSSDHVTRAPPPSRRDLCRRRKTAIPLLARQEGRKFVYEKFVDHAWENGKLHLKVRWFGFSPEDDTCEPTERLPLADVMAYTKRHGIEGTAISRTRLNGRGQEDSGGELESSTGREYKSRTSAEEADETSTSEESE